MGSSVPLVNLAPLASLALLAGLLALVPLSWVWLRRRAGTSSSRLAALTALTLFLTFDLVVFGAFTRLTDSGLGCPDWPGCYAEVSPLGADAHIRAAESALPDGPVTFKKAWIEMVHRYLAMTVGVLVVVIAAFAWRDWRLRRATLPFSPWWPTLTLAWVVVQGLFGKYTVTLKLYPAVVTLHLLGALVLLALLAFQHEAFNRRPLSLDPSLRRFAWVAATLLVIQIALGGWVSTNYAVLACTGYPQCNGVWWPPMDFASGFTLLRELGRAGGGGHLSSEALTAIHMAHRWFALFALAALLGLAWRLQRRAALPPRRFGLGLALLALAQLASGLSNVVLGWPLVAALAHSAGAAAMVLLLALLLARTAVVAGPAASTQALPHAA